MSLVSSLIGFGLRQVIGEGAGSVAGAVEQRFRDHSGILAKALERANERAWQSLGVALAGDGFLDRVKLFFASGDDKRVRQQVAVFLQSNAISFEDSPAAFRQACLDELKRLRKSGLLSTQGLTPGGIASQAASFTRHTDALGLVDEARRAVAQVADALPRDYPNLSRLLRTPTLPGQPLLAGAFAYFFRREVETDDELAHGLFFDGLRQLSASQAKAFGEVNKALAMLGDRFDELFDQLGRIEVAVAQTQAAAVATHGAVLDLQAELQQLGGLHLAHAEEVRSLLMQVQEHLSQASMQRGEVRPQHSFSIRGEDERQAVKSLLVRFRQLPAREQRQTPALLNGLGQLQIGAGDFAEAAQTFTEVVNAVDDPAGKAEASYNAYRAALEVRKWDAALQAILQAASLNPQRFAPFPLHRYEPRGILGAGGFGTAFLCHDRNFDEDVVVKSLHAADLERGLDDVFREARTLRQLSHPAIIGVRDCEYADASNKARPYLVMDYFPGGTLEQFIDQRGTLTPEQLQPVAVQIAQGMLAAHGKGILHRDLKPANVLVRKEGDQWRVRVIDFGLALRKQAVQSTGAGQSTGDGIWSHSVAGTLKYAPPEQMGELRGAKSGPYSDVYAFGKTCCYALFRTTEPKRRQWSSIPAEMADVLEKCIEQELAQPHTSFEPVLEVLTGFVPARKGRSKDAGSQPQQDLTRLQEEEKTLARLVSEALDRTGGRPTAEDTAPATELLRHCHISAERAEAIIDEVREAWKNARKKSAVADVQAQPLRVVKPYSGSGSIHDPLFADMPNESSFYLGLEYDLAVRAVVPKPIMYESKDLCTHGVVVGMTGSGKTGLSIALLEEAAIDGIPCIIIDCKGELSNLLLQFPDLAPADFLPWLNVDEAIQKGVTPQEYAQQLSDRWRKGLADTGQSGKRIRDLRERSEYRIYTPGSATGLPLSILQTFTAPRGEILLEELDQKIDATVSALLGLTGMSDKPVQSKEHIFIGNLLKHAWTDRPPRDLDLPTLIEQIQDPPITQVGTLDLDKFYKAKDRMKLASSLNNILATSRYSTWLEGDPLDLTQLLAGPKAKHLIFSIAHLDDAQRMFFVTLLLAEVLRWTRKQSGSSSLRAILYFDEAFGFLPPYPGNPPTKQLLMTLLKQARSFGVGVLLGMQNPADIDYKALSNVGTWFIGKLQTERDKARLLDGIDSAASERGRCNNRKELEQTIAALGNRNFLLHNIHRGTEPVVFQARWTLSYLRGPMTREEISRLMRPTFSSIPAAPAPAPSLPQVPVMSPALASPPPRPPAPPSATVIPVASLAPAADAPGVVWYFVPVRKACPGGASLGYQAFLLGFAEVTGEDKKMGRKHTHTVRLLSAAPPDGQPTDWANAETIPGELDSSPRPAARFSDIPMSLNAPAKLDALKKSFADYLAKNTGVPACAKLCMTISAGEDVAVFQERCRAEAWKEFQKKLAAEKETYRFEFARYQATPPEASAPAGTPWEELWWPYMLGNPTLRTAPSATLAPTQKQQLENLEKDWHHTIGRHAETLKKAADQLGEVVLSVTKGDIKITHFGLAWVPFWIPPSGGPIPAYRY